MKTPVRCNVRACQRRRTLAKHPALYPTWPTCRYCGAPVYVDTYRLAAKTDAVKRARDRGPVCKLDCLPHPHTIADKRCCRYNEWRLSQAMSADPKRRRRDDTCPF